MWWILTALTASFVITIDILQEFDLPLHLKIKSSLWQWILGFIGINTVLSIALHFILFENESLKEFKPWAKSLLIGIGYVVIAHIKLGTIKINGQETSIGLEWVYENSKRYIFKHINREIVGIKYRFIKDECAKTTLKEVASKAQDCIAINDRLTAEEKDEYKTWLLDVLTDPYAPEEHKKILVIYFVTFGDKPSGSIGL